MILYYILLIIAALFFASQFLLVKQFQKINGDSFYSTLKLSLFAYSTIAIFFFVKANVGAQTLKFGFSLFTLGITLSMALISLSSIILSVKVLGIGNMSIYSIFTMTGGMILPALAGLIFYNEKFSLLKCLAIILMVAAVLFTTAKSNEKSNSKKALFYYIAVFFLNGLVGVLVTVHQNQPLLSAYYDVINGVAISNSDVFMSWYGISTVFLSTIVITIVAVKNKTRCTKTENIDCNLKESSKSNSIFKTFIISALFGIGYGILNGLGNYFNSVSTAPTALGSSVVYPLVTGGTILFSTLLGRVVYKEKITLKTIIGFILILSATIIFMFA